LKSKRNIEAFEKEHQLQILLKKKEDEKELVLSYFDGSGFNTMPCIPYAWQPQGKTLEINSQRSKQLNVLGFIRRNNQSFFHTVEGRVNSDTLITAFDGFANHYAAEYAKSKCPCIVILDNASVQTSKKFLEKSADWLAQGVGLHFLPTYSPELNLIEILWRKIKYEWLPLEAYMSYSNLKKAVLNILDNFGEKYTITFT